MTIKRIEKVIYKSLRISMAEEASLEFKLSKIHETINYVLDEIKQ